MNKFKAATVTAAPAVTAVALPMATAGPAAAAASGVGKCVKATRHPSNNSVNIVNDCKKAIKVQIAERFGPDSDCYTIRAGGRAPLQGHRPADGHQVLLILCQPG
ncbi:hypothetical protein OG530_08645 [Streptomyces decoyicus]|uniref:hypothetical protein n=1 Tax=Streptomyces decoyicus TaxID=249567 RepID=UPI002E176F64